LSFVRSPDEVNQLKELVLSFGSTAMIVAKIEKAEAMACLKDIVFAADAVMVARGDLGVEIDLAETPMAQKRIVSICQQLAKPVIVATQMLDSMQHSPRPTRAEVSDVANAIFDGADACMLSGETAIGDFPRESVEMMNSVMQATEASMATPDDPLQHIEFTSGPGPSAVRSRSGHGRHGSRRSRNRRPASWQPRRRYQPERRYGAVPSQILQTDSRGRDQ
jgi:pyruvate kinase